MKKITLSIAVLISSFSAYANNFNMPWGNNNGANWNIPNMNWGNGNGYNNGTNWNMPSMNWGNSSGNNWNMPSMNWGNNTNTGYNNGYNTNSNWNMPNMNWGNNANNGFNNWNVPSMNWGNGSNNQPWNYGSSYRNNTRSYTSTGSNSPNVQYRTPTMPTPPQFIPRLNAQGKPLPLVAKKVIIEKTAPATTKITAPAQTKLPASSKVEAIAILPEHKPSGETPPK